MVLGTQGSGECEGNSMSNRPRTARGPAWRQACLGQYLYLHRWGEWWAVGDNVGNHPELNWVSTCVRCGIVAWKE